MTCGKGWVLSVQNWFWTGQWTKLGINRLKPDKTGQNLREAINHSNGCETIEDGQRVNRMKFFVKLLVKTALNLRTFGQKSILDIIILNKLVFYQNIVN